MRLVKTVNGNTSWLPTVYNRNYGRFDYARTQPELLTAIFNRKLTHWA